MLPIETVEGLHRGAGVKARNMLTDPHSTEEKQKVIVGSMLLYNK